MIKLFDELLRRLLVQARIPNLINESQIGFEPPNDQWRSAVSNRRPIALNIYLIDLRENRKLRSNERIRTIDDGVFSEEPAPLKLDCHYLITAWSPALPDAEPTLDEHDLLYGVMAALAKNDPLSPSRILTVATGLNDWPERFRNLDLPLNVAPAEGFAKLSEFWHSMGQNSSWKPGLHLVTTLPVVLLRAVVGSIVTTQITDYFQNGLPETSEVRTQIGGYILDTTHRSLDNSPTPVVGAWVQLETSVGTPLQVTETDDLGRFSFSGLQTGHYRLHTRAVNLGEKIYETDVPANTGEYNVLFP